MTYGTEGNKSENAERIQEGRRSKVEGLRIEVIVDDLSVPDDTDLSSL